MFTFPCRSPSSLALLFALVCLSRFASADDPPALSPDQPYSAERVDPVTYKVELAIAVTPPAKTKQLRVWVPIPPSDAGQEVSESQFSTFPDTAEPKIASEPLYGNRFAYFEFDRPQGAQIIRHAFTVKTWELRWKLKPGDVQPADSWPASFAPYRRRESQAVVVDDRFERLVQEIVPSPKNPLTDLSSVMSWVHRNFEYDHNDASLQADAVKALQSKRGHCSDYHGFCAALGRAMGYPTRVTYGLNAFPKSSPSHCKLEAFLPPHGWVSFDVSETQKLISSIRADTTLSENDVREYSEAAIRRLESGFRDNTWFVQTRGTDYDLAPPASRRVAVVRTIYAEADGQPLPEPDPANGEQREFAWMTAHRYTPDREVPYPFTDVRTLQPWLGE